MEEQNLLKLACISMIIRCFPRILNSELNVNSVQFFRTIRIPCLFTALSVHTSKLSVQQSIKYMAIHVVGIFLGIRVSVIYCYLLCMISPLLKLCKTTV